MAVEECWSRYKENFPFVERKKLTESQKNTLSTRQAKA